jgi:hypothetical protein
LAFTVGDFSLAGKAFLRLGVDVLLVLGVPLLFFYRERVRIHQRDIHLSFFLPLLLLYSGGGFAPVTAQLGWM